MMRKSPMPRRPVSPEIISNYVALQDGQVVDTFDAWSYDRARALRDERCPGARLAVVVKDEDRYPEAA